MTVSQTAFRQAVFDAAADVPEGLVDGTDAPAGGRFSVYRNNVIVSLTEALRTAFPLVYKLVGAQAFERLAAVHVRAYPPASPLMMQYGADFPKFLEGFGPLSHLGYLPDCARLDLLMRQAYHAADAPALSAERLQCDAQTLAAMRLSLAPATRILRSAWPIFDIWRMNIEADAPKPRAVAQDLLITRPEFDPGPHLLPAGGATWLLALANGMTLAEAQDKALSTTRDFDLAMALSLALQTCAFADFKTKDS